MLHLGADRASLSQARVAPDKVHTAFAGDAWHEKKGTTSPVPSSLLPA